MACYYRQSSKVCTILKPDSCNGNTANCHSLITPGLLLQLQQSLFIKLADFLYILIVNTEIYVLSVEIRLIFLMLLRFYRAATVYKQRRIDPWTKTAVRDIKYAFAFWYRREITDSKPFRLKEIVFTLTPQNVCKDTWKNSCRLFKKFDDWQSPRGGYKLPLDKETGGTMLVLSFMIQSWRTETRIGWRGRGRKTGCLHFAADRKTPGIGIVGRCGARTLKNREQYKMWIKALKEDRRD